MNERIGMSKKLRFDVFKRDLFACQYCGATPSETVVLEVDHIHPVAGGGTNDIDNLVTACFACNRGKGAALLTSVPMGLAEKAEQTMEREAQLRGFYDVLEGVKQRKDEELWSIADIYMERYGDDDILRSRLASIRSFLGRLNYYEVQEAMEIATNKFSSKRQAFSYFCGICWRKVKRANGEEV